MILICLTLCPQVIIAFLSVPVDIPIIRIIAAIETNPHRRFNVLKLKLPSRFLVSHWHCHIHKELNNQTEMHADINYIQYFHLYSRLVYTMKMLTWREIKSSIKREEENEGMIHFIFVEVFSVLKYFLYEEREGKLCITPKNRLLHNLFLERQKDKGS